MNPILKLFHCCLNFNLFHYQWGWILWKLSIRGLFIGLLVLSHLLENPFIHDINPVFVILAAHMFQVIFNCLNLFILFFALKWFYFILPSLMMCTYMTSIIVCKLRKTFLKYKINENSPLFFSVLCDYILFFFI